MALVCYNITIHTASFILSQHSERRAKEKKLATSVGLTGRKALDSTF